MKTSVVVAIATISLLSACTATRPVVGQMERSDESFNGAISGAGYRAGSGELTLVSNHKATCRGSFVYTSSRKGDGVLRCDDGRTGTFHVSAVGSIGNGYGDLAGQRFTFTIGTEG